MCFGQKDSKDVISSFNPGGQYILLTFDDGPHAILTPKLLDILAQKKVKATFFVIGVKAKMHPKILSRMAAEGHEVANHSWNHPVLSSLDFPQVKAQMQKTNRAISDATGNIPSVMRPPYGNTNPTLNEYISKNESLKVILWSIDTKDWQRPDSKKIVDTVKSKAKPGDIILCHDIHPGTIEAMPGVIDALQEKGFEFVTVSQMLSFPDDTPHRSLRGGF